MFKVKEKETGNIYIVYDIQKTTHERSTSIRFLVYTEYNKWIYMDSDSFEPYVK